MASLHIEHVDDKATWENYILSRPEANFLHSFNWGQFHQALGKKIFYLGLFQNQNQIGAALIVKEVAKRGTYFTIAGGPILDWKNNDHLHCLLDEIKRLGVQENAVFIRIRPQEKSTPELNAKASSLGFTQAPMHITADLTLQLDLTQTADQLLAQMRKNTRYAIRQSQKIGIVVKTSQDPDDIKQFNVHQLELAQKHHFVPFSYRFLHEQFKVFTRDNQAVLFHSYLNDQLLASAFVILFNREAVYHYGISTEPGSRLPGSYACQWAAILYAQRQGCLRYNLWGVSPPEHPNHRYAGVDLFKRGFGGQEIKYLPAHDLPLNWRYQLTKVFELLRKKSRHL